MIHKVNVVKKIAFLLMTMALAGAIVACQGAVTSPATVAKEIGDMEFDVGGSAKKITLTGYFNVTDPEYKATPSKESVAAVSVSGAVLTVTPTGAGTVNVEVTADGDEGKVSQTFTVTVNAPTVIVNEAPTVRTISPVPLQVAGTKTIELSDYFTDPEGDALRYTAVSRDHSVATVTDPGAASMITITAVADGTAEITVSASDDTNDAVPQTFDVMVSETPPPNERPTSLKPFEDVTLTEVDDPTEQIDLSGYFDDADDEDLAYTPSLSNDMYATATVDGSMLTITAVAAGTVTITVTASDGKESVSREIDVTVNAESNKAPALVAGLSRDVFVTVGAAAKMVDLSQYFRDPKGDVLTYSATSSNNMYATATVDGSMLTVTPGTAAGTATITATAFDGELSASLDLMVTVSATPNVAPEVSGSGIPDQFLEMDFMETKTLDLSMYFSDSDSGPNPLKYTPSLSNDMYATATVDGSMLTIEAVAAGSAMITVTATDGADEVMDEFSVTVINPAVPTGTSELPDKVFDHDDMAPWTITLSGYFSGATDYDAVPDDESVVKATEAGGVLTLTPVNAGLATVTVTPSNSGGAGESQNIRVTVESMPVPKGIKPLQDQPIESDAMIIMLSEYFSGATDYDVESSNEAALTALNDRGTLTLTPHMHGVATVTVTPINSGGAGTAKTFKVTVRARPTLKTGKMLDDMRLVTKKSFKLELSKYLEDLDGSIAKYSTVTSNAETVAVYTPVNGNSKNMATDLDKAADTATVILHARKGGTATITVTVTDSSELIEKWMFVVTVVSENELPTIVGVVPLIPSYSGATRFKLSDKPKKPIDGKAIKLYFLDDDLNSEAGDRLTFTTMSVIAGKGAVVSGKIVVSDAEKVADPVATAVVEPDTWDGDRGGEDKFTVTVTPNKAGAAHDILIVATDLAGAQVFKRISVQVNHAPKSEGAQESPLRLSSYDKTENLKSTDTPVNVPIVAPGGGYFSDKDIRDDPISDTLTCSFRPSITGKTAPATLMWDKTTGNAAKKITESVTLVVTPKTTYSSAYVPMTVTVWCSDGLEKTDEQTFSVNVTAQASIH